MVPFTAMLQLSAAYVPLMVLPSVVAVTANEHLFGRLGLSVIFTLLPLTSPVNVPLLLSITF